MPGTETTSARVASGRRAVVRGVAFVVGGAAVSAVVHVLLHIAAKLDFPWGYAITLGACAGAVALVLDTISRAIGTPPAHPAAGEQATSTDNAVLAPWERRFRAAGRDRRGFVAGIQPALRDLADERLRLHRGTDLDVLLHDPGLARTTLGEELWLWLTTTDRESRPPTAQEMSRLLTAIGQL